MYDLCLNFRSYTLPLTAIEEIDIRLVGVVMQRFDIDYSVVHFEQDYSYDSENQVKYNIRLYNTYEYSNSNPRLCGPIKSISGKIGPLRRDQFGGVDMSVRKLLELIADDRNDLQPLNISINGLMIQEKDISGVILKKG